MKIRQFRMEMGQNKVPAMVAEQVYEYHIPVWSPESVAQMCNALFGLNRRCEEHVMLVVMDSSNPIAIFEIAHGQVSSCNVNAADIIKRMLLCGSAVSGILVHNHPSGSVSPSDADRMICNRIQEAFAIVGLDLEDFLIVGDGNRYLSFREEQLL